jgi:hypothetical protein
LQGINTRDRGVLGFAVIDHQPTGYPETTGQPFGFNAAKSVSTELALFQGLDPLDHVISEIDHENNFRFGLPTGTQLPLRPCQLRLLAGQEHGRTIPLADVNFPNRLETDIFS